jgi:ubiquinone/menaquinone biosynthesis C-methylase UbiE
MALFAGCAGWLGLRAWAAHRPAAFPYIGRPILDIPRPLITRRGLLGILDPVAGERMLEVGPGTGYYTLPVAARLGSAGVLEILDVRRSFLDHTVQRARGRGLTNIVPTLGDGMTLPYPDRCFDAAYAITVLGEIADPEAALGELRRVLKPGGRLIIGEILVDPDFTTLRWLVRHARAAGLLLERRTGTPAGYFARFRAEAKNPRPAPFSTSIVRRRGASPR